jgi:hypothetical protein
MRDLRRSLAGIILILNWGASPGLRAAETKNTPKEADSWPNVLASTYKQRNAASPLARPAEAAEFAFPHPHATSYMRGPLRVEPGALPVRYPDQHKIIWLRVPWKDDYTAYLEKRRNMLSDKDGLALVAWCEQQRLPECAEFELRRLLMSRFMNFQDPFYQQVNRAWLKYADRRQVSYSFPIPVSGVWCVLPDATEHHRMKAGAAYAFDLVIMKNGRIHANQGRNLEDHYAFGQPVLAQADGIVEQVVDKQADTPVGALGGFDKANVMVVDYGGGIRGLYAHLKKGSAKVKPGDRVTAGQPLAEVGNSGASGTPHLHFTLCDCANFSIRGRFRVQVQKGATWQLLDGEDLKEGLVVQNPRGDCGL